MSPIGAVLDIRGLEVRRGGAPVLDGFSLDVEGGALVAVVGPNGAGKSTLLQAAMGLLPVSGGFVALAGRDITRLPPEARARAGIGYVPEGRRVFPGMTVRDNFMVAADCAAAARAERLDRVLALFGGLRAKLEDRAWTLSGGQQQMVAIGRALMTAPRLLLLDEPTLGLAPALAGEVMAQLRRIADEGTAVLVAEQNVAAVKPWADRLVELN